jgi:hypothetical protein
LTHQPFAASSLHDLDSALGHGVIVSTSTLAFSLLDVPVQRKKALANRDVCMLVAIRYGQDEALNVSGYGLTRCWFDRGWRSGGTGAAGFAACCLSPG